MVVALVVVAGCKGEPKEAEPKEPEKVPTCDELAQHWVDTGLAKTGLDDPRERRPFEEKGLKSIKQGQLSKCSEWSDDAKRCFGKAGNPQEFHHCSNRGDLEAVRAISKATAANLDEVDQVFAGVTKALVAYHQKNPSAAPVDVSTSTPFDLDNPDFTTGCCRGCMPTDKAYGDWDVIGFRPEGKHFVNYMIRGTKKGDVIKYNLVGFGNVDCDDKQSQFSMLICIKSGKLEECSEVIEGLFKTFAYRQLRVSDPAE